MPDFTKEKVDMDMTKKVTRRYFISVPKQSWVTRKIYTPKRFVPLHCKRKIYFRIVKMSCMSIFHFVQNAAITASIIQQGTIVKLSQDTLTRWKKRLNNSKVRFISKQPGFNAYISEAEPHHS